MLESVRQSAYFTLLGRNRDYRLLWLGALLSYFGDWFNLIASADLVASLSNQGTAISYLFLARFLPSLLFSPLAGVLADRFDRRRLLIATDLLRAVVVLAFLLVRSSSHLSLFYILLVGQFALSAIFIPTRAAILANIVPRGELVTANALDSLTWSVMLTVGALVGGVVASLFGRDVAFTVDALTFLLSAVLIGRIRNRVTPAPDAPPTYGVSAFIEGLRYVAGAPVILITSLAKAGGALAWSAINVLEVTFARNVFPLGGGGNTTLGLIYAVSGFGTGVGPLLMRRWLGDTPTRLRWGILAGFGSLALGLGLLGLATDLKVFLLGTLVRTLGSGTLWVFSAALLQTVTPDAYRGRVFAFEYAALTLAQSMSTLWAGYAQDQLGWSASLVARWMAGVGLATGLLWLIGQARWRQLMLSTGLPDDEAQDA